MAMSTPLEVLLAGPGARWVRRCFDAGFAHGSEMAEAFGSLADNVARARDALKALETEGWIVRGRCQPTREQCFFDSGRTHTTGNLFYAETFGWTPNRNSAGAYEAMGARPEFVAKLRSGMSYEQAQRANV